MPDKTFLPDFRPGDHYAVKIHDQQKFAAPHRQIKPDALGKTIKIELLGARFDEVANSFMIWGKDLDQPGIHAGIAGWMVESIEVLHEPSSDTSDAVNEVFRQAIERP